MADIYTTDLLTVAEDALRPPAHLTPPELAEWSSRTLLNRLPLIREALRIAREDNNAELATQLVDRALYDHPNPARAARVAGGDGASLPLPAQQNPPFEGEFPIPEHVLGPLLYRNWNLTIEGQSPHETYVARRPIGWLGEGDPFERIIAPTRRELLRLLGHRLLGTDPSTA